MDYVKILKYGKIINLTFYIEHDKPFEIGEKMNGIYEKAYMNGYNWEAFLNYYLEKNSPEVLEGVEMDPEAGILTAYYDNTFSHIYFFMLSFIQVSRQAEKAEAYI